MNLIFGAAQPVIIPYCFQEPELNPDFAEFNADFEAYLSAGDHGISHATDADHTEQVEPCAGRFLNVSREEIEDLATKSFSGSTHHNTRWAVKIFEGIKSISIKKV